MSQIITQRNFMYAVVDQDEPPPKKLISDADVLIKQLSEKQCNTSTSLQEQLATTKEFNKATELTPLSKYSAGTSSLQHFQERTKYFHRIESLKAADLTPDDIELYFDSLKPDDYIYKKHKNWEKNLLLERLKKIQETVKEYKEKQLKCKEEAEKELRKHDTIECGLSVKPDSVETKLLKFALNNQKGKNKSILPHPIDTIKEIVHERFSYLNEQPSPSVSKIRRKARKLSNRIKRLSDTNPVEINDNQNNKKNCKYLENNSLTNSTKWDISTPIKEEIKAKVVEKKIYTCKLQNFYTIRNGEIVKLNKNECEARDLETVKKLDIEEIRKLPKFQNYEPGRPSKVLYIKNLSNSVKEEELQILFKEFDKEGNNISYKIMNGKMRGQAFITFPDEKLASQALEEVNGIFLRNKPVIIQFGHAKDKE